MSSSARCGAIAGCALALLVCGACVSPPSVGRTPFGRAPWRDGRRALVIDLYEKNAIDWQRLTREPRVAGVIHRASIGLRADKAYAVRHEEARRRGLLWGSYHVGMTGYPEQQADFYLRCMGAASGDTMVLDLEGIADSRYMNLDEARRFIRRIHDRTGRYPVVYANRDTMRRLAASRDPIWARTRLWYACYRDWLDGLPTRTWTSCVLWQFSSQVRKNRGRPYFPIAGASDDIDVSVFDGDSDMLRQRWPL